MLLRGLYLSVIFVGLLTIQSHAQQIRCEQEMLYAFEKLSGKPLPKYEVYNAAPDRIALDKKRLEIESKPRTFTGTVSDKISMDDSIFNENIRKQATVKLKVNPNDELLYKLTLDFESLQREEEQFQIKSRGCWGASKVVYWEKGTLCLYDVVRTVGHQVSIMTPIADLYDKKKWTDTVVPRSLNFDPFNCHLKDLTIANKDGSKLIDKGFCADVVPYDSPLRTAFPKSQEHRLIERSFYYYIDKAHRKSEDRLGVIPKDNAKDLIYQACEMINPPTTTAPNKTNGVR